MLQIATFKCLWVLDFAASVVCGGEAQRQINSRDEIHPWPDADVEQQGDKESGIVEAQTVSLFLIITE